MSLVCASKTCELPPLNASDARIEVKAVLPARFSPTDNVMQVNWKSNGEAAFHVCCWKSVLKMARSRQTSASSKRKPAAADAPSPAHVMKRAEKLMVVEAANTAETFDSEEDMKKAAKKAATLILKARHCIVFTGAGISTSAGLGDFRGKSGKWTEEDSSAVGEVINEAFQQDVDAAASSSHTRLMDLSHKKAKPQTTSERTTRLPRNAPEVKLETTTDQLSSGIHSLLPGSEPPVKVIRKRSKSDFTKLNSSQDMEESSATDTSADTQTQNMARPVKRLKVMDVKPKIEPVPEEPTASAEMEETEETVDYENLRPTYTHEALTLLTQRHLLHFVISQNCDGLHLLSGLPSERISELHGNVFVEKCSVCHTRFSRNLYVLNDEASQYYEDLEDYGKTDLTKPRFAVQCELCGLSHRTGSKCEEKGCRGFLEDTIINFGDNLEEPILDLAYNEASLSDLILCLGTTLTVTPACDIVEEAKGQKPLIICNRQKTKKDRMASVRVFGDCDVFMREVLGHLIDVEDRKAWEEKREERMKEYNTRREIIPPKKPLGSGSIDTAGKSAGQKKRDRKPQGKSVSKK